MHEFFSLNFPLHEIFFFTITAKDVSATKIPAARKKNLWYPGYPSLKDTKNTGLLIFNSLKQKKLSLTFLLTVTEIN